MEYISSSNSEERNASINILKDIAPLLRTNNVIVKETNELLIEKTNILNQNQKHLDEIK